MAVFEKSLSSPLLARAVGPVTALPKNAALLLYFPGENGSYVWLYTKEEGLKAFRTLPASKQKLQELVRRFFQAIEEMLRHAKHLGIHGFGPDSAVFNPGTLSIWGR